MSTSRQKRREYKPKSVGIVPLHERKVKKSMQNEGGYYEGMPGVTVDDFGNRKIIDFIVQPDGNSTVRLMAHPRIATKAIENACKGHNELNSIVTSAVMNTVFSSRKPLHLLIRLAFWLKRRRTYKMMEKKYNK